MICSLTLQMEVNPRPGRPDITRDRIAIHSFTIIVTTIVTTADTAASVGITALAARRIEPDTLTRHGRRLLKIVYI